MRNDIDSKHAANCGPGDCGDGLRNRFFRGKAMGAEEFRIEQHYLIERRRLLSRGITGHGIAYGFKLDLKTDITRPAPLKVGPGLGLDCHGAEIVNAASREIRPDDAVMLHLQAADCMTVVRDQKYRSGAWLLSVHYAERNRDRVMQDAGCECRTEEFNFLCETLVFSLRWLGERGGPCGETDCKSCDCSDPVCGDGGRIARRCQCVAALEIPGCGPGPGRRRACEWKGLYFDPDAGLPLACVAIEVDATRSCDSAVFAGITDACGPRTLIKTNERLYDLIRGCDLTQIAQISWQPWHRKQDPVPWADFSSKFLPPASRPRPDPKRRDPEPCPTDFTVHFSKPVQTATLTPDAFAFYGITRERGTAWGDVRRIPIVAIDTAPDQESPAYQANTAVQAGTTNRARIVVEFGWFNDEVADQATESWFEDQNVLIEIQIRGDLILDCNGVSIDANPRGAHGIPSGNGTPGGTFVSAFKVAAKV